MMSNICNILHGLKPALMMVVVQTILAGTNVFAKLAVNDGMSMRVLVAYRYLFAAAFVVPIALVVERKRRPKLTWVVLFQACLCGLLGARSILNCRGSLFQNLFVESIALTSATFASAMSNLMPPITFVLAISLGLERLVLGTLAGKAKVMGTLVGVGGAMLLTFYEGPEIKIWSTHANILHIIGQHQGSNVVPSHSESYNRLLGALLVVGSCFSYAGWLITQAKMSESYPCHYSSTALMSVMGSIQATIFALCTERDSNQWKLGWNIRLLTVAYLGIAGTGVVVTLIAWCVRMRGPLFASVFNPLILVLVAFVGSLILDEKLHLGSIIGSILIVCGLYIVLWGKSNEIKRMNQLVPSKSSGNLNQLALS